MKYVLGTLGAGMLLVIVYLSVFSDAQAPQEEYNPAAPTCEGIWPLMLTEFHMECLRDYTE